MVFPYNVSKFDYIRQFSYTSRLKSLGRKVMTRARTLGRLFLGSLGNYF